MPEYKVVYTCEGYTSSMYEIHILCEGVVIGCLYYLEDSFIGTQVNFDKWRKYEQYKDKIPTFDPKDLALTIITEHELLGPNR
jgi:hypothetical protein